MCLKRAITSTPGRPSWLTPNQPNKKIRFRSNKGLDDFISWAWLLLPLNGWLAVIPHTETPMANLKDKMKEKIDQAANAAKKSVKEAARKSGQKMQEYGKKLEKKGQ